MDKAPTVSRWGREQNLPHFWAPELFRFGLENKKRVHSRRGRGQTTTSAAQRKQPRLESHSLHESNDISVSGHTPTERNARAREPPSVRTTTRGRPAGKKWATLVGPRSTAQRTIAKNAAPDDHHASEMMDKQEESSGELNTQPARLGFEVANYRAPARGGDCCRLWSQSRTARFRTLHRRSNPPSNPLFSTSSALVWSIAPPRSGKRALEAASGGQASSRGVSQIERVRQKQPLRPHARSSPP